MSRPGDSDCRSAAQAEPRPCWLATAAALAQRVQPSAVLVTFEIPFRQLPLVAAARVPLRNTCTGIASTSSLAFTCGDCQNALLHLSKALEINLKRLGTINLKCQDALARPPTARPGPSHPTT